MFLVVFWFLCSATYVCGVAKTDIHCHFLPKATWLSASPRNSKLNLLRWETELSWTWEKWAVTQKSMPTFSLLAFHFGEYRFWGFWKDLLHSLLWEYGDNYFVSKADYRNLHFSASLLQDLLFHRLMIQSPWRFWVVNQKLLRGVLQMPLRKVSPPLLLNHAILLI